MNEHMKQVLNEMCRYVGTSYADIEPLMTEDERGKTHWPYMKYSWSSAAEAAFRGWLMEYLRDKGAWRALAKGGTRNNKRNRELFAKSFVFMYGWRTEK